MSAEAQLTPMMQQYRRIKGELPKDALLLFRLGDFYKMFFEDAQTRRVVRDWRRPVPAVQSQALSCSTLAE